MTLVLCVHGVLHRGSISVATGSIQIDAAMIANTLGGFVFRLLSIPSVAALFMHSYINKKGVLEEPFLSLYKCFDGT